MSSSQPTISLVECDSKWVPKDSEAKGSDLTLPLEFDISTSRLLPRWRHPAPIPASLHLGIFESTEKQASEHTVWDTPVNAEEGQKKFIIASNKPPLIPGKQYVFRFFIPRVSESLGTKLLNKFVSSVKFWDNGAKPGDFLNGASRTLHVTSAKYRMEQDKAQLQSELDKGTAQINVQTAQVESLQKAIDLQRKQNEVLSEKIATLQTKIDAISTAPSAESSISDEDASDIDMTNSPAGPPPHASPSPAIERHRTASSACDESAEPDAKKTKR